MWTRINTQSKPEISEFIRKFSKKARFLVDQCVGKEAADFLRSRGWNAVYAEAVGLRDQDDQNVYAFAWREDRIILTHDSDFLDDQRFPPHRNPGVIVLPGANGATPGLHMAIARVHLLIAPYREGYRYKKVLINEDDTWTITEFVKDLGTHTRVRLRFGKHGEIWEDQ
jgi:predicted nuclease of predicted toxin-antitoxin system